MEEILSTQMTRFSSGYENDSVEMLAEYQLVSSDTAKENGGKEVSEVNEIAKTERNRKIRFSRTTKNICIGRK